MADASGFTGFVEIEIFSADRWWREDPLLVAREAVGRTLRNC
jgi:hypothetical protein